jgi:hypothetical protein
MQDTIDVRRPTGSDTEKSAKVTLGVLKDPEGEERAKSEKTSKLRIALPWFLLLLALVGGLIGTMYYKNQVDVAKADPDTIKREKNQAETDRVLTALKKVLFIGESEAPTVARVEDPEKLKKSNETFYKDVQKNDYLVIYPKRAIIYRESINQIINIAPIINTADLEQKQQEQSSQPAAETKTNTTKTTR